MKDNELKKLGMQTEFKNWLNDYRIKPKEIQIGSRVFIKAGVTRYSYTTPFSEGIVDDIKTNGFGEYEYYVKFHKITSSPDAKMPGPFKIQKEHLELI